MLVEHKDSKGKTSKSHYSLKHYVRKRSLNGALFWYTHRCERVTSQSVAPVSSHGALFLGCSDVMADMVFWSDETWLCLKWWFSWCSEVILLPPRTGAMNKIRSLFGWGGFTKGIFLGVTTALRWTFVLWSVTIIIACSLMGPNGGFLYSNFFEPQLGYPCTND